MDWTGGFTSGFTVKLVRFDLHISSSDLLPIQYLSNLTKIPTNTETVMLSNLEVQRTL